MLSKLFDDTRTKELLGPDVKPPFEPATGLPELFREAERTYQSGNIGDERSISDVGLKFPGIAGVVIVRDRKDREEDFISTPDEL